MMSQEDKIKTLEEEIRKLKLENRGLKKLVNSRRFKFAEKVATGANIVFPKNTKRRNIAESIGSFSIKTALVPVKIKKKIIKNKILKQAKKYQKIIIIDSIPWDVKLKQRPHHFAYEFNKLGYFVIYIELANYFKKYRFVKKGLITLNSYDLLDLFKGLNIPKFLLIPNTSPTPLNNIKIAKSAGFKLIYDYIDEFHEDISGDLSNQLKIWNYFLKNRPLLCTVTANRLLKELTVQFSKNQKIILSKNAVNIDHFDYKNFTKLETPLDMKKILSRKNPIIGFYGAMAPWIDYDLLNNLAKKHKNWEFVFLGIDYGNAISELNKARNIHFLGPKDYSHLPNYAKCFDCAIIPFKKGEIAKATSPVKLFEYMAAGLPTVCTKDLEECKGYDYVYIAKNEDEFSKYLGQAIKEGKDEIVKERLLEQAKENTWEQRVKEIDKNIK